MVTKETADEVVAAHLRVMEREMDNFGSALPENRNRPPHNLVVSQIEEYEFGWVYCWCLKEALVSDDMQYILLGNAPIIVDRTDGKLYWTGTAQTTDFYVAEFLSGIRHPVS